MKTKTIIIAAVSVVGVGALSYVGYRMYVNATDRTKGMGGEGGVPAQVTPLGRNQRDAALRVAGSAPALTTDMVRRAEENRARRNSTTTPQQQQQQTTGQTYGDPSLTETSLQTDNPSTGGYRAPVASGMFVTSPAPVTGLPERFVPPRGTR